MSKAFVQKPAPAFEGIAVKDGAFEDVKLSDYLGKWLVSYLFLLFSSLLLKDRDQQLLTRPNPSIHFRQVLFFYPM